MSRVAGLGPLAIRRGALLALRAQATQVRAEEGRVVADDAAEQRHQDGGRDQALVVISRDHRPARDTPMFAALAIAGRADVDVHQAGRDDDAGAVDHYPDERSGHERNGS